jgi:hypothetical protein
MAAGITVRLREVTVNCIRQHVVLLDTGNEDLAIHTKRYASVPVDETWCVVETGESVIFRNAGGLFFACI